MTVAPEYLDLHRTVDLLRPEQVRALQAFVESMIGAPNAVHPHTTAQHPSVEVKPTTPAHTHRRRRLSFAAAGSGPTDLAEHADQYIAAGGYTDECP